MNYSKFFHILTMRFVILNIQIHHQQQQQRKLTNQINQSSSKKIPDDDNDDLQLKFNGYKEFVELNQFEIDDDVSDCD
ncbi:hypothetical protein DERP_000755 [Dermatophagoides pteronyssinus]|uniref:Uncharacterized protein n=1 Tax=Dermatophagoides pteronyssinus TaxID=6956 RepID=A0ABQ8J117_DERPT|nr:hypothetical protein DERP_000755 [Dermatophagoides pteronyssinus]